MSKKSKRPYKPGDWLLIPVKSLWFVSRIIRMGSSGVCLGLFFGPFKESPPRNVISQLRPELAVICKIFFATYAENGRWSIIDGLSDWSVDEYKVPAFKSHDLVSGKWRRRVYDEDYMLFISEEIVSSESEVASLPDDGLANSGAMELSLAHLAGMDPEPLDLEKLMNSANVPASHYIYFHDGELAEYAKKEIEPLGLVVTVRPPVEGIPQWLVLAQHPNNNIGEAEVEVMESKLRPLVQSLGGEYDGWDRPSGI